MDTVLDFYADMNGVPQGVVLGGDKVKQIREEKDEQTRQREMQAAAVQMTDAAPKLAGAAKDILGPGALGPVMGMGES
jgi:hypothetical protein